MKTNRRLFNKAIDLGFAIALLLPFVVVIITIAGYCWRNTEAIDLVFGNYTSPYGDDVITNAFSNFFGYLGNVPLVSSLHDYLFNLFSGGDYLTFAVVFAGFVCHSLVCALSRMICKVAVALIELPLKVVDKLNGGVD